MDTVNTQPVLKRLGLSDLAVGQKFVSSRSFTRDDTKSAALQNGDHNKLHFEDDFARSLDLNLREACLHITSLAGEFSRLIGHHFFVDGVAGRKLSLEVKRPIYHNQKVKFVLTVEKIDNRQVTFSACIYREFVGKERVCVDGETITIFPIPK